MNLLHYLLRHVLEKMGHGDAKEISLVLGVGSTVTLLSKTVALVVIPKYNQVFSALQCRIDLQLLLLIMW